MGYQALLFCPDEKMARTVTQVLSELDFTVVPCTEPFAAVKKLMSEHFDAVVVDCDNEQNATLLFKSARNTAHNQSALAVAVVEGQAGVAKAFRIGANLVLTKPINVEQAKGTLRVARGLLRKSEGVKPAASPASSAVKPAVAAPLKLVTPQPSILSAASAPSAAPVATASVPAQKAASQPSVVASASASASTESADTDDIFDISEELPSPSSAKPAAPNISSGASATAEPKIKTAGKTTIPERGTSAASAAAPAREPKPWVSAGDKSSTTLSVPESPVEKAAGESFQAAVEETSAPAFTFGGNVDETKSSGGSKKALLVVAAVVVIAALGYAAWMQWGHASEKPSVPAHVTSQPVASQPLTSAAVPSNAAPTVAPGASSPGPGSIAGAIPDSASAQRPNGTAKTSADTQTTASLESTPAHPGKGSKEGESSKPSPSAAANKAPATKADAEPIMIKSGNPRAKAAAIADAPAPSLSGIAPAETGALPNLVGSPSAAPTPVLQTVAVSQGVSQGLVLKRVQPTYPANARQARIEGAVQLMATISRNGDISAVKVLSGEPQLAHAAVDAVKQWKYKPYLLNGSPVEIQTQVTINFKLPH